MQKVVGSSPIIRSRESPAYAGFFFLGRRFGKVDSVLLSSRSMGQRAGNSPSNRRLYGLPNQAELLQLLEHPCVATHSLFGSSSSSPENSGVTRRECGYTRYVL
jgi:hypothetical protein